MVQEVKYLFGSQEDYDRLAVKEPFTFYKTPTKLYLGALELTNTQVKQEVLTQIEPDLDTKIQTAVDDAIAASGGAKDWSDF